MAAIFHSASMYITGTTTLVPYHFVQFTAMHFYKGYQKPKSSGMFSRELQCYEKDDWVPV